MGVLRAILGLLSPAEALQTALAEDRARQHQEVYNGPQRLMAATVTPET